MELRVFHDLIEQKYHALSLDCPPVPHPLASKATQDHSIYLIILILIAGVCFYIYTHLLRGTNK
jgi:hypothetical protein